MKAITRCLKVLRTERTLSQLEVGQRAGLKEYRYWRIEAGYTTPTDDELEQIAKVFKLSLEELKERIHGAAVVR